MKKIKSLNILLIIIMLILLASCKPKEINTYNVYYMLNDITLKTETVNEFDTLTYFEPEYKQYYLFDNWYEDDFYEVIYDFNKPITNDTYIYAHYLSGYYKVQFVTNNNETIPDQFVLRRTTLDKPNDPVKQNHIFLGWYTDVTLMNPFNFDSKINGDLTLYAKYELDYSKASTIKYILPDDIFFNKNHLFESFIGDFYYFLKDHTRCNLDDIPTVNDFYTLFKTWELNGRSDLYHIGDRFSRYFVSFDEDGLVQNQPTDTFIGYLYQQGKYVDFINHLITFFAYWRTDEGYSQSDPHGNDFFYSSWASLVDTAKFFYFTSDTLHTKYPWFTSKRVKNALDNIPGVLKVDSPLTLVVDNYTLPIYNIEGYTFNAYYIDETYTTPITLITLEMLNNSKELIIYVDLQSND